MYCCYAVDMKGVKRERHFARRFFVVMVGSRLGPLPPARKGFSGLRREIGKKPGKFWFCPPPEDRKKLAEK